MRDRVEQSVCAHVHKGQSESQSVAEHVFMFVMDRVGVKCMCHKGR